MINPAFPQGLPLVALLGQAHDAFVRAHEAKLRESGFDLTLAQSRNILRHLEDGPMRAQQIVECGWVSKQAVSQQISSLEKAGYVNVLPDPSDARSRLVVLTRQGETAQRVVQELFTEVEQEWADAIGCDDVDALRRILSTTLQRAGR